MDENIDSVLYFETHSRSEIPDELRVLFTNSKFLAKTGLHNNREFYRLSR